MGRLLYEHMPEARAMFERADALLEFPLSRLCFEGPAEELTDTIHAQPALFVTALATLEAARRLGLLMTLQIYNSLTRRKEPFQPVHEGNVGIYVCGPTVYGHAHLGHAKSYVSFDVVVRYLRYLGYKVRYVQNITDVGHLTDDADEGEDKIVKRARLERVEPMELVEMYTRSYYEDMDAMNVLRPNISPRATCHIPEMIELTKTLLESGHAYEVNGSVYFSVPSFPEYGKLSGRRIDELEEAVRIEANPEKRHPADFALWKRAEPGHILRWPSPWGWGYPGWHIECSVMSTKYLGQPFDCRNLSEAERRAYEAQGIMPVIRFKTPLSGKTEYTDVLLGKRQVRNTTLDDFILLKSDGFPTYHLANIVDDHFMEISHVMRADEWLPSLPRHILLYEAFGWEPPAFIHLPLIVNKERKKLSKRDGAVELDWYRQRGYLPEAMVNFLALMGWSPGSPSELMSREEMVRLFSLERLSRSPAVFDPDRLNWFNRQHMKRRPRSELAELGRPYLEKAFGSAHRWTEDGGFETPAAWIEALIDAVYEEIACLAELPDAVRFLFEEAPDYAEDAAGALRAESAPAVLTRFQSMLAPLTRTEPARVHTLLQDLRREMQEGHALRGREVMFPLRAALTGRLHGPQLDVVVALLGRQRCILRLRRALEWIEGPTT